MAGIGVSCDATYGSRGPGPGTIGGPASRNWGEEVSAGGRDGMTHAPVPGAALSSSSFHTGGRLRSREAWRCCAPAKRCCAASALLRRAGGLTSASGARVVATRAADCEGIAGVAAGTDDVAGAAETDDAVDAAATDFCGADARAPATNGGGGVDAADPAGVAGASGAAGAAPCDTDEVPCPAGSGGTALLPVST